MYDPEYETCITFEKNFHRMKKGDNMKKLIVFLIIAAITFGLVACGSNSTSSSAGGSAKSEGEKVKLKISTPDPDSASVTLAAQELAKIIGEKSNGEIEVTVHPNGTLYGGDPSGAVK